MVLVDWVACSNQPLSKVESEWFRRVTQVLHPKPPNISASMLAFDIPREVEQVEGLIVRILKVHGYWFQFHDCRIPHCRASDIDTG